MVDNEKDMIMEELTENKLDLENLEGLRGDGEAKWYVVHTYSGHENKVKVNISYKTKGLTEDELDELYYGGLYAEVNLEETKKEYEENEYTCK